MITPRAGSRFFEMAAPSSAQLVQRRQDKLAQYVENLAAISDLVDFQALAARVDAACPRPERSHGGRPPWPTAVMVRMVVLQALYGLSDEATEHQVLDRLSFQRFCRLEGGPDVPDARTLWLFKQRLADAGLGAAAIFAEVNRQLQAHGLLARGGQIVDATIVSVPVTRVPATEPGQPDAGQPPAAAAADRSAKRLAHVDRDARWTVKASRSFYGYKLHVNVDARHKLVWRMRLTPANVDDGNTMPALLYPNTAARLWADRGYDSAANRELLSAMGVVDGIARRAKPGRAPSARLRARNRAISRPRARVEHVFASIKQHGGRVLRAIGLQRNALAATLLCVAHNLRRAAWLLRPT